MLKRCWNDVGTMFNNVGSILERCWNDGGMMLEQCWNDLSISHLAKIGRHNEGKPCKEIGTPSLKAVGEKSFSLLNKRIFFILPPWPSRKKAPAEKYSVEDVIPTTM